MPKNINQESIKDAQKQQLIFQLEKQRQKLNEVAEQEFVKTGTIIGTQVREELQKFNEISEKVTSEKF